MFIFFTTNIDFMFLQIYKIILLSPIFFETMTKNDNVSSTI